MTILPACRKQSGYDILKPVEGTPFPNSLRANVQIYDQRVSEIRGLSLQTPPGRRLVSQKNLDLIVQQSFIFRDISDEKRFSQMLTALGLLPPSVDFFDLMNSLEGKALLGYFYPSTNQIFIVQRGPSFTQAEEQVYVHEYLHALQDANALLPDLLRPYGADADASRAVLALIEGDAMLTEGLYMQRFLPGDAIAVAPNSDLAPLLAEAPPVLRALERFVYVDGLAFVTELHRRGGWEAVNRAYQDRPVSSEQVLHIEKYLARESPVALRPPSILLSRVDAWRVASGGVFGELLYRTLLEIHIGRDAASQAAAGWGTDSYVHMKATGGETGEAVALVANWDTQNDAREFFEAYRESLRAQGASPESSGSDVRAAAGGRYHYIGIRDRRTTIIVADSQTSADHFIHGPWNP
ncbi:MAG: hypothetical protein FJ039_02275 [Chloroflexi bacterium]|nr:hypothetical protein [Chloroflexota bacterium]